jgi:hypothetical protein
MPFFSSVQKFRPDHHKHNKVQLYDLINPNVLIKTRIFPITQVLITYKYPNTHNTHSLAPSVRLTVTSRRSQLSVSHTHSSVPLPHNHRITVITLGVSVLVSVGVVCLHSGSLTRYFHPSPLNSVGSLPPQVPPSLTHSHTRYGQPNTVTHACAT